jgi:hypothetical protein
VLTTARRDVWVDWEDIPPASNWQQDVDESIDAAESVVFAVGDSSLSSEWRPSTPWRASGPRARTRSSSASA